LENEFERKERECDDWATFGEAETASKI